MRKYTLALALLALSLLAVLVFELPDRIAYALYGMEGYSLDKYEVSGEAVSCNVSLHMADYTQGEMPLLEAGGARLAIADIEYTGNGYRITFESTGESTFGSAFIFACESAPDTGVFTSCGPMALVFMGSEGMDGNTARFIFELVAGSPGSDLGLERLECEFALPGLMQLTYTRRK